MLIPAAEETQLADLILAAPANDYIRYKPRSFDLDESQQPVEFFPAHPSAETEAAWADLFDSK